MKKTILTVLLAINIITSASAAFIDLGQTTGSPSSIEAERNRLNGQISLYNQTYDPDLYSATGLIGTQTQSSGDLKSIILNLSGFDGYIMMKWGNFDQFYYINDDNSTKPFNLSTATYLGNGQYKFFSSTSSLLPRHLLEDQQHPITSETLLMKPKELGLSHYTTFAAVPEPASWIYGLALFLPFLFSTDAKRTIRIGR